jgi:hypothetical protein
MRIFPIAFLVFAIFTALHKFAFGLALGQSALWALGFTAFHFIPFFGALCWLLQIFVWIAYLHVAWWQALLWSAFVGYLHTQMVH